MVRDDFKQLREEDLAAALVAGEAAHEPDDGQRAVVLVAMNRVHYHKLGLTRSWYPDLRQVILQPKQFSCFDDHKRYVDMMEAADPSTRNLWAQRCRLHSWEALAGFDDVTLGADHYHADYIPKPEWTKKMELTVRIGHHLFYRATPRGI